VLVDLEAWALLDATQGLHRREHCAATAPRRDRAPLRWRRRSRRAAPARPEYRVRRADSSLAWILSRAQAARGRRHGVPARRRDRRHRTARGGCAAAAAGRAESARRAEIEASRARIVEAADAARRRLEGDLHDGAQQQLVVASLTLNRAAARARWTPAEALVVEALDQVRRALAELRELASGIHPALLSDHGLPAALQGARRAVARAGGGAGARAAPSPGVEAAPYFMAAEALTNVA
jgi:signal transduction histidine kinase